MGVRVPLVLKLANAGMGMEGFGWLEYYVRVLMSGEAIEPIELGSVRDIMIQWSITNAGYRSRHTLAQSMDWIARSSMRWYLIRIFDLGCVPASKLR